MSMEKVRIHYIFHGTVQGVGFRYKACYKLMSFRGIIRLSRSMSVWSYFHAPMNFLTSPHRPQLFIGILWRWLIYLLKMLETN